MALNVPEEEKPKFNKNVQSGLNLFAKDVQRTLGQLEVLQPETIVEAYNKPVQAPVLPDLTPLERYAYAEQPQQEVADIATPPARESMAVPQEDPNLYPEFANQAQAQFSRDAVSITPYEQAVTDIVGAEVDSLRNDAGEIAKSPLEVFSKPLNANSVRALGLVDQDGNPTERGQLFYNLQQSGVFNEDGTINEKGQAYLMPRSELKKPENNRAFKVWYDDNLDEPEAKDGEIFDAVVGFGKNIIGGLYNSYQLSKKLTSLSGLADVARQTVSGKETVAELQVDQIAALEQVAKNFQAVGGYADILQGLAGRALYDGASVATGVPMQDMKDAAEENLYLARQRQWTANENLRDLEVGAIAEAMTGLDGFTKVAQEAKNVLGEERFNSRYAGSSAVTELVGDPANLMPAAKAFKVATSAPIASRAIIKAQQILGKTAQIEKALNEAQTIVEAGNAILKKEAVAVPLAQRLFTDISARAGANPELLARSQQAMDVAQRITASADEVRAAMPNAIASVDQLAAKRASLATRIPEEYAKKVVQTAELGAKVRAMPASVMGSILEGTGETISKIDNAVTGYLSERGMDQAYNAALGAAGVVGLAGNPIVGAIGAGAAALKTGKFLTEYGKIFKYVGREMKNARGQIPFWKRVAYHTAPKSLGQGLSHTFNIFELGGATSDVLRRTGRGIVAAYPSDLFFEYLSDGGEMRPQTMTRAAAESFVLGGAFAAGGGAFMGTKQRMRELAIGDEINFRQGLVDTNQKARFEALPPVIKRSIATYSMANPTLNYNFIESGGSEYDPNSNTANINIYSTNPLKALVAHETLHHTIIKNNMEGGIAAMFLGDTKTNSVGGFFRSRDGKLDPEFEAFANKYYDRMRASGMSDAEIKTTYPLEKAAVEYFIEQHSDQYADMAESGELGAISARGEVRKKLGSILETILPKIPVLRDLHFKSGGAIDANGAFVTGVGILGDFGVSQNPIAKKMFREMNKRSSGMMPGQFEPLFSDKEGSGAPLFFDPANEIDVEMMHPMIQVDANDKPILKDGRPIALSKEVDMNRAIAGLSIIEAYRKLREGNYAPEKGEAYVDDDGEFQPGWVSDSVLTQMFAKHPFNNEQKRMIRQTNKMVKEGTGQRMVMINFPATTRNKAGKVVYKTQGATIRDTVPVAVTISKDGNILYGLMSVTKLQENIKKRAQSRRGKKLYSGNIDMILRDVQAMMDFHKKGEDSINWFAEKYGIVEADQRKKFINTMFGLLNKKEQAVLNPMLLEDGVKSSDNVYRTYRADRVSKAIPMSPDEYAAMPFSYEAVSQVRMPEAQRAMPEGEQTQNIDDIRKQWDNLGIQHGLSERSNEIEPGVIKVPKEDRNQGIGNKAMSILIDYADQVGKRIVVSPTNEFGSNKQRLTNWYKKLGFVENKGRNKDYTTRKTMYRDPISKAVPSQGSRFMPEGVDEDKFYSQLERVITDKVPTRATAQQIMATIDPKRGSGVKADEIKWSGIEQALASLEKDGKVSKEDLLNYLRNEGRVRFEEVTMGGVKKVWTQQEIDALEKTAQRTQSWDAYEQAVLEFEDQQLGSNANQTGNETKFAQYVLPGGENYREVVLAMPTEKGISKQEAIQLRDQSWSKIEQLPDFPTGTNPLYQVRWAEENHPELYAEWNDFSRAANNKSSEVNKAVYTSSHFPNIPNYVAHMRTNERVDADGRPGLFVEEFQSDRHQEGRKKGYRGDLEAGFSVKQDNGSFYIVADDDGRRLTSNYSSRANVIKAFNQGRSELGVGSVADAPFRTTWPIQLFKRALRDAVDSGKEWVGWTTGETQNDRFDLSKQADSISVPMVNADGSRSVRIDQKDGTSFKMMVDSNGIVNGYQSADQFTGKRLDEVVGKDMADKIIALESPANFEGNDLKVGGSGMKGFYDNILPKEIGKYVEKFDGKVEKADMTQSVEADIMSGEEAETGSIPIWKVNITPKMRKISQTGQMRFMPEKLDSDYMKAVESGDVEAQQRMVDEAAKQAGYRQGVLWHGSRGKKFTVFDETKGDRLPWMEGHVGHYFSPDKNIASAMGSNVLGAYLKMDNPLILDAGDYSYSAITPARKKEIQKQGYDSVIGTPQTNAGKQEFIVFDSNQIKSADPITRDDSGNVIPLSKRFDVGSRDIRYMPEGESNDSNLKLLQTKETLKDWAFGQANWKDWYSEHQETLDDFFGDQAGLFQEILAVTSQAASVKANVGLALKAFGQLMRNEEFDGKLRGEEKSGYLPAVIKNLNAIKNKTQVGGRKISNYKSANEGDSSKVVVDRHIARMLFGVDTPTAKQYAKAESVLSDVAKELGWKPAQVQAALWAQSIVMSGKEPVSYGAYLKSLEAKKLTKKELISGLKGNQITRRIGQLSGSGYGSNELSKARGRYSPASENAPKGKKGLGASTPKPKRSTAKGNASAIANAAKLK
jgi:hypothetical protein